MAHSNFDSKDLPLLASIMEASRRATGDAVPNEGSLVDTGALYDYLDVMSNGLPDPHYRHKFERMCSNIEMFLNDHSDCTNSLPYASCLKYVYEEFRKVYICNAKDEDADHGVGDCEEEGKSEVGAATNATMTEDVALDESSRGADTANEESSGEGEAMDEAGSGDQKEDSLSRPLFSMRWPYYSASFNHRFRRHILDCMSYCHGMECREGFMLMEYRKTKDAVDMAFTDLPSNAPAVYDELRERIMCALKDLMKPDNGEPKRVFFRDIYRVLEIEFAVDIRLADGLASECTPWRNLGYKVVTGRGDPLVLSGLYLRPIDSAKDKIYSILDGLKTRKSFNDTEGFRVFDVIREISCLFDEIKPYHGRAGDWDLLKDRILTSVVMCTHSPRTDRQRKRRLISRASVDILVSRAFDAVRDTGIFDLPRTEELDAILAKGVYRKARIRLPPGLVMSYAAINHILKLENELMEAAYVVGEGGEENFVIEYHEVVNIFQRPRVHADHEFTNVSLVFAREELLRALRDSMGHKPDGKSYTETLDTLDNVVACITETLHAMWKKRIEVQAVFGGAFDSKPLEVEAWLCPLRLPCVELSDETKHVIDILDVAIKRKVHMVKSDKITEEFVNYADVVQVIRKHLSPGKRRLDGILVDDLRYRMLKHLENRLWSGTGAGLCKHEDVISVISYVLDHAWTGLCTSGVDSVEAVAVKGGASCVIGSGPLSVVLPINIKGMDKTKRVLSVLKDNKHNKEFLIGIKHDLITVKERGQNDHELSEYFTSDTVAGCGITPEIVQKVLDTHQDRVTKIRNGGAWTCDDVAIYMSEIFLLAEEKQRDSDAEKLTRLRTEKRRKREEGSEEASSVGEMVGRKRGAIYNGDEMDCDSSHGMPGRLYHAI